jgi:hypothetical protein
MFVLQTEPRWTWPAVARVPDEAGGYAEHRFRVTFRLVEEAERERLAKTEEGSRELLRRSVVALHDVQDEAGQPVPHSPALVEALLGIPWTRQALIVALAQSLSGLPSAAAAGN